MPLEPMSRSLVAAAVTLFVLSPAAVGLRLLARRRQKIGFALDDYTIVASLVIALGVCAAGIYAGARNLFAVPFQNLSPEDFTSQQKVIWISVLLTHITFGTTKLSILLLYKRIFVTPKFRLVANILMGVVGAWMIAAFFGQIFSLNPIDAAWNIPLWWSVPGVARFDYQLWLLVMTGINIGLDLVVLAFPLFVIKNLHVNSKKKLSIAGIFGLGFFCVIASALRFYWTYQLYRLVRGLLRPEEMMDPYLSINITTWTYIWSTIECCVSIITACLPTLAPLLHILFLRSFLTSLRSFFTLHSKSDGSHKHSGHSSNRDQLVSPEGKLTPNSEYSQAKDNWLEMHSNNETTVQAQAQHRYNNDEEAALDYPGRINVKQTFNTGADSR